MIERWLRRVAVGSHALAALWLVVNGVGHSLAVIARSRSGALGEASVPSLLSIGAGLVLTGIVFLATLRPLVRKNSVKPALLAVSLLAVVLGLIAARYGFRFLGGTIAVATLDSLGLVALAVAESKRQS